MILAGCGGGRPGTRGAQGPTPTPAPAPVAGAQELAGRWARSSAGAASGSDGDVEDAREVWSVHVSGRSIQAHYLRVVLRRSADGQVFACNRGDAYTRRARISLDGTLAADGTVTLTERKAEVAPSLCDDGVRRLTTLRGRLVGARLELERDGEAVVLERPALAPAPPGAAAGEDDPDAAPTWAGAGTAAQLAGLWQSVVSRRDESGQLRTEFEIWHLIAEGSGSADVTGYYDHVVTVTAREGQGHIFACSGTAEYTLRTRYRVAGTLLEGVVVLGETSYETVPGPCESNLRRLERYQGRLAGAELLLTWGGGAQLLRRVE